MTSLARSGWGKLAFAASGLLVFASAAILLPAFTSLGCALGWQGRALGGFSLLTILLMGVWLAHLLPLAALAPTHFRAARSLSGPPRAKLVAWLAFVATLIGLAATLRVGFPLMVLPQCQ